MNARNRWVAGRCAAAALALGGIGLSACSKTPVAPVPVFPGGELNFIQQQEYPQDLAFSILASIDLLTLPGDSVLDGGFNIVTGTNGCPTIRPTTLVDEDADGIPDLDSASFSGNLCATQINDSTSVAYTGKMILSDPTPTTADGNFDLQLSNFLISSNTSSLTIQSVLTQNFTHEGNVSVTASSGALAQVFNDTVTEYTSQYGGITTNTALGNNWNTSFTSTLGGGVSTTAALPNGSFTITGTTQLNDMQFSRNFQLVITTPTPMLYDPTCNSSYHITSGELKATATSTTTPVTVASLIFTFNGCVSPTVTYGTS